ncbi:MAG: hypothetical protein ACXWH0_12660 [Acidimicrobiia bacterium]
MPYLFIEHDRRLKIAKGKALPLLPADVEAISRTGTAVISCRLGGTEPDSVLAKANALRRFPVPQLDSFHFHAVESDSPLAPLWLWDVAHRCPVGSKLTFSGDDLDKAWLRRRYFATSLEIVSAEADTLVLKKVAPLPAERDAGLDCWSFCIPVGPGDPTQLNAAVGRILELRVPQFEIILCGTPGDGFWHLDRVRIIGKDLPSAPLIPGLKKNMLAEAASYPNLCIMHDRVFLPTAFMRAIRAFGDMYPMTTFQSLYFDDRLNLDYRRYSDLQKIGVPQHWLPTGVAESDGGVSPFSKASRTAFESSRIVHGNPLRFDRDRQYATGSLYLCKRSVWLMEPQSNAIPWSEFEDAEHGLRASEAGIPSRINPHAITQSISARPLFSFGGVVAVEDAGGNRRKSRAFVGRLPLPRKPLLRQSPATMSFQLKGFLDRHSDEPQINPRWSRFTARTTGRKRLWSIAAALRYARSPLTEQACRDLIRDFERLVLGDQLAYATVEALVGQFRRKGPRGFAALLTAPELINQVAQRPGRGVFAITAGSLFPAKGIGLRVGSAVTALVIRMSRNPAVVHAGGYRGLLHDVLDTTPCEPAARFSTKQ